MPIFGNSAVKSLDSLIFKREYRVISDDEVKGSAMLTSRRTEALRKLDENIPGRFAVLREDKKLYLIVSDENSFEVNLGKKAASVRKQQKRVADEAKRLTSDSSSVRGTPLSYTRTTPSLYERDVPLYSALMTCAFPSHALLPALLLQADCLPFPRRSFILYSICGLLGSVFISSRFWIP